MKRTYCKLDDKSMLTFELQEVNGKTHVHIIDRKHTHDDTPYKGFANVCTDVDKYRLLKLADFIYEYCNDR